MNKEFNEEVFTVKSVTGIDEMVNQIKTMDDENFYVFKTDNLSKGQTFSALRTKLNIGGKTQGTNMKMATYQLGANGTNIAYETSDKWLDVGLYKDEFLVNIDVSKGNFLGNVNLDNATTPGVYDLKYAKITNGNITFMALGCLRCRELLRVAQLPVSFAMEDKCRINRRNSGELIVTSIFFIPTIGKFNENLGYHPLVYYVTDLSTATEWMIKGLNVDTGVAVDSVIDKDENIYEALLINGVDDVEVCMNPLHMRLKMATSKRKP